MCLLLRATTSWAQVSLPPSDPSGDLTRNWKVERTFDADGNVVAETKNFADGLGRPIQSQVKNLTERHVFARQTVYNSNGLPVLNTLAAPINNQEFKYKENFISSGGSSYGPLNFEGAKASNPDPVDGATTPGTLGYYYSPQNTLEPYTPVSTYPYGLTEPFLDPIGGTKRLARPGDALRMGQGHESSSRTLPLLNDLEHYAAARSQFISPSTTNYIRQGYKTVVVDGEGRESISFTSKEGQLLATCLSGAQYPATSISTWIDSNLSNWQGYPAYQDIHITAGTQQLAFTVGGTVRIINLKTGAVVADNFAITASSTVGTPAPALSPGFYRIVSLTGAQWFTYDSHYGDFAYTYYNDAGQPIASVAPKGINLASNGPLTFVTRTTYNSAGLPLTRNSEDEGLTEYVYAQDGRIRFSQNARQRSAGSFSYVNYDKLYRVVESGEFLMGGGSPLVFENQLTITPQANSVLQPALLESRTRDQPLLAVWRRSQVYSAWYDTPFQDSELNGRTQEFLLGNVAKTQNDQGTTWYSYDEMGRVVWTVQNLTGVGIKTVDYKYELSGKVLEIAYQKNQLDAFYHHYEYDADQRLADVYTSPDGLTRTLQAHYVYYLHGPLKRVEIANRLQGVDYLYTLEGQLKSINHVNQALDPGRDSPAANGVPKDLFGLTLDYYSGDYRSAALPTAITPSLNTVGGQPRPTRYDGMVRDVAWRTASGPDRHQMAYTYNAKSQLTQSDYGKLSIVGAAYTFVPDALSALEEGNLNYDANGNISTLRRRDETGGVADNFTYDYAATNNRLAAVHAPGTTSTADPNAREYDYDAIGQMTHQRTGQSHRYLQYDAAGQVTDVFRAANSQQRLVSYAYDDRGFRCKKTTYDAAGAETLRTYYVRDAQGSILANYEESTATGQPLHRTEVPLYGAGRIGTITHLDNGTDDARYELTDQRGDARVIFHRPTTQEITEDMELDKDQKPPFTYTDTYRSDTPNAHSGKFVALLDGRRDPKPMVHTRHVDKGDTITFSVWGLLTQDFVPYRPGPAVRPLLLLGAAGASVPATQPLDGRPQSKPSQLLSRVGLGVGLTLGGRQAARLLSLRPPTPSEAWVQYRVLDEQGREVEVHVEHLPYAAVENWYQLELGVRVQQSGTIELSVGTSEISGYTYFDDFAVQQTGGLIVQEQHQYAYGAPLPGLSYVVGNKSYRHGYQGQSAEKDPETGWDNFEARTYDARIGRWLSPDPVKRIDSPYTGMGNNPVAFGDADGRDIIVLNATAGAGGFGHVALLVQNRVSGGWDLYSKNGTDSWLGASGPAGAGHKANQGGRPEDHFNTLEDFYTANAAFGKDASIYDRSVYIKTSALEDALIRERAMAVLKCDYNVSTSSCLTTLQEALSGLNIGIISDSGMEGGMTPNSNFDMLRENLVIQNSALGRAIFGRPREYQGMSNTIRAGIITALRIRAGKLPVHVGPFKTGVPHM
ncbi:MAG: hypothetical protein M3Y54_07380 [Bacteroidota bacterium]|nr:hypothetical protein [Bacteroidota bacterium]